MVSSTRPTTEQVRHNKEDLHYLMSNGSYYPNVSSLLSTNAKIGDVVATRGYYEPNDTGGAIYKITQGVSSDGGDITLGSNKFAKLLMKDSFTFATFGVKYFDQAAASSNDNFISQAISRCRVAQAELLINGRIYHRKPVVVELYTVIRGISYGSDYNFTPRFIKVGNDTSGIPPLAYPGLPDSVPFDIDAGIIVKRQNALNDFSRGIILEGFLVQSLSKSTYALYAPHMVDFSIHIDSRGFNGGIYTNVAYLGSFKGRHVGLTSGAVDTTLAIGWRSEHFSTVLDCGNTVRANLSFNGFNRGIQVEYYGNLYLDLCTFEGIKKQSLTAITPIVLSAPNSTVTGTISCESCAACLVRATAGSNINLNMSAIFHVTQDNTSDGLIHVLNGGRLEFNQMKVYADLSNQLFVHDNGGYLSIPLTADLVNVNVRSLDPYRLKDYRFSVGNTTTATGTTFASGEEVTFSGLNGVTNAALSGGTVQFNSPSLVKVSVFCRGVSSGSVTFGLNGVSSENSSGGQTVSLITPVVSGDILNIKAVGALTLSATSGIRVTIEQLR